MKMESIKKNVYKKKRDNEIKMDFGFKLLTLNQRKINETKIDVLCEAYKYDLKHQKIWIMMTELKEEQKKKGKIVTKKIK